MTNTTCIDLHPASSPRPAFGRFMGQAHVLVSVLLSLALVLSLSQATAADLRPAGLSCEYRQNPLGIDARQPRLSWKLEAPAGARGLAQSAYRVLAASSAEKLVRDRGDLWDSGKVGSEQQLGITYAGKPLSSGMQVWWKVKVWDNHDQASQWSAPARWEMGLLKAADWQAQWIEAPGAGPQSDEERFNDDPAPLLRKEFTIHKPVLRARAYISGLGYYELRLNGRRVGDHQLDPGWTAYAKRVLYSTYDVTAQLKQGRNAVGIILGHGWYDPLPLRFWGHLNLREHLTVGKPRAILRLVVDYADGTSQSILTDGTWRSSHGPILRNNVYLGELYDARREQPGWDQAGFQDSNWKPAVRAVEPLGPLQAQSAPPIRITRVLRPVRRTEPEPGTYIFDFGQNFAGWVRLRVQGPPGTAVRLRYGELLYPDGRLDGMTTVAGQVKAGGKDYVYPGHGVPKTAWQTDTYILKGQGEETYTPRFTFHGFRYVEVTGYPGAPPLDALQGLRLNSDVERVGSFICSNERFNRIEHLVEWTFLSNLFSVQSDCPGREKLGYGGDIFGTSEAFALNFNMVRFYEKTLQDYADAARPNGGLTETAPFVGIADEGFGGGTGPVGWGTVFPHLLWQLYTYYGDRRVLEEYYPVACRWVEFLQAHARDGILDNGISDHESLVPKPRALTGTGFYYCNALTMARIARVLGKTADAQRFHALAEDIKNAFNRRFLRPATGAYDTGTQACQAFALFLDLVPEASKQATLQYLVHDILDSHDGHLTTGLFGTRFLPLVLSDLGRMDVACTVVNQSDFPGWGYMIQKGATTLWEHWAFSDNVFSHNHPMFGSIGEWLMKAVAGIQPAPEMVGWSRLIIRPQPAPEFVWARGDYQTLRGLVSSHWRVEDGKIFMRIALPPNTRAKVFVPALNGGSVLEGGKPAAHSPGVRFVGRVPGAAVYEVGSGRYEFEAPFSS